MSGMSDMSGMSGRICGNAWGGGAQDEVILFFL